MLSEEQTFPVKARIHESFRAPGVLSSLHLAGSPSERLWKVMAMTLDQAKDLSALTRMRGEFGLRDR